MRVQRCRRIEAVVRSWREMSDRTTQQTATPALVEVAPVDESEASPNPSFEAFYREEHDRLYRALCLVTHDRHEAEDLAQDAFVRLFERWERVGGLEDPSGYLYRTAMNGFRSGYRRAALALKRSLRVVPHDDGIERLEATDWVIRALAPLSRRQRAAVVLTDLLGFSSEEAGRLLAVRASTVRMHSSRAHAALRRRMGEEG